MTKQEKIIKELKVKPTIDVTSEVELRKQLIKDALAERGFKRLVLGISGGVDSAVAAMLCQQAINELKKEHNDQEYKFIAMRLPYNNQLDEKDCQLVIDKVKPDEVITYNIASSVDAHIDEFLKQGIEINDHDKGNIKARERMVATYIVASTNALVVGTDHAAEAICGFYTKWGDAGADVIPLYGLCKRQVRSVAGALNVPECIIIKAPTADLEDNNPGVADEVALGVTYDDIDNYLCGLTISEKAQEKIEYWHKRTKHKRSEPRNLYEKF